MPVTPKRQPIQKSIFSFFSPTSATPQLPDEDQSTPKRSAIVKPASVVDDGEHESPFLGAPRPPTSPLASPLAKTKREDRPKKEEKRYEWLENIRDASGNCSSDPGYDPKTLFIPTAQWKQFTPFEKQYWEIKSQHMDCVVFFKKGKFFELYEMDADVASREFDLRVSDRVNMRMAGVPEATFDFWMAKFIARGYRVAKVDQLENSFGKELREQQSPGGSGTPEKLIARQLTGIVTAGTQLEVGNDPNAVYCLALLLEKESQKSFKISASFVDVATGRFFLSPSFSDSEPFSKVETLIAQVRPKEIVHETSALPATIQRMIRSITFSPIFSSIPSAWSLERTRLELMSGARISTDSVPQTLSDSSERDQLSFRSFGLLVQYLDSLCLSRTLLPQLRIYSYDSQLSATHLQLDGQTLLNLEIFQNAHDGQASGTLSSLLLPHCLTAFGKRKFSFWLSHPLCQTADIQCRLRAVTRLLSDSSLLSSLDDLLDGVPDLERILCKIHAGRCKVSDFCATLESMQKIAGKFSLLPADDSDDFLSSSIISFPLAAFNEEISRLVESFDISDAKSSNQIFPIEGHDEEFDEICQKIRAIEGAFDRHLKEQRARLNCSAIRYKDLGKEIFQLEIPIEFADRISAASDDYLVMSKTRQVIRCWTATIRSLVRDFQLAQERRRAFLENCHKQFLAKFSKNSPLWVRAIDALGDLDCLRCLVKASNVFSLGSGGACAPVVSEAEESSLMLCAARHPCLSNCIPNDLVLDSDASTILLTGPNMGGKSTLLRMVCVQVILAQLGCYVPSKSMRIVPFNRIFTRIGASDNIMAGTSTFMQELSETGRILRESTAKSLCILDELGRGTSTFDGYSIAYGALHYLTLYNRTRCLFSTHYHMLGGEVGHYPMISQKHMACFMDVENDRLVFLYQLAEGACEKSHGLNVAKMAGLPDHLIRRAAAVAENFDRQHLLRTVRASQQPSGKIPVAHHIDQKLLQLPDFLSSAQIKAIKAAIAAFH